MVHLRAGGATADQPSPDGARQLAKPAVALIFEPKMDGFRALAIVRGHRCELVSRNGHPFKQWPQLAEEVAHAVRAHDAVLDGEICCLEPDGRTHFNKLLFRRDWPFFYAFDVLLSRA